jgi:BirA family biotin operon repressor/biotin-[acetyl-CoA-carboxylase] ligase
MIRTAISPRFAISTLGRPRDLPGDFTGPRYSPEIRRESNLNAMPRRDTPEAKMPVDLQRALERAGLEAPTRWDDVTASTNGTALAMAADGAPEWTLVGAGHQTAGKGRLGRTWHDRAGEALMVSIVLRPAMAPPDAGLLTLLAGAAWAEAIEEVAPLPVRCGWPNDLLVGPAKVGGILAESSVAPDGSALAHVVIGSGVNLVAPEDMPGAVGLGTDVDPTELLGAFLRSFRRGYHPSAKSFADDVTTRWRTVAATLGRRVLATTTGGGSVEGVAVDLDRSGGLVVETDRGREVVTFGALEHLD